MVRKFDFKMAPEAEQKTERPKNGFGQCEVYGCPRHASMNFGAMNCRYHHGKSGSSLAQITLTLKNHTQEFDWYEFMLNVTAVDFLVGDVARKAPGIFSVHPNEDYKSYKARVNQHIENLLAPKSRLLEVAP